MIDCLSGTNNDALVSKAFTLSAGYKAIEQQTRRDFYVFQDEVSRCVSGQARYKDSLSQGSHYGLTDEFAAAVCKLPLQYDQNVYKNFIDTWGTVRPHRPFSLSCMNNLLRSSYLAFLANQAWCYK